ncbi:hypothetical protein ACFLR4_02830 [Bacteroidota bacterium]
MDTEKPAIKTAVEAELKLYPEERLIDLYKSFFQGYWGPGHLIPDSTSAHNYLTSEMKNADEFDTNLWQSLGHYNRYFRLNLKFVKDGIIPEAEYLAAFIQSANNPEKPELEDWIKEWSKVINIIEESGIEINNYEEDKNSIEAMLNEGNYVVHHSNEFREIYNPHYRVISKKYFNILIEKYYRN